LAYSKSYTYADGTVLTADNQNSNDEAAKFYVNQEVIQADFSNDFTTSDIARGEVEPILGSHSFTTGHIYGGSNSKTTLERAYFTSHIKPTIQTSNSLYIYTPLYETGTEVDMEYDGLVIYDFGGTFISQANDVQSNGKWDSILYLQVTNIDSKQVTLYSNTASYTFEESDVNNAYSGNHDPFGDYGNIPASFSQEDPEDQYSTRRWCGFCQYISLSAGRYAFTVVVNAKVEQGFASARSFNIEVLYV
jgi:hypothetical protein